MISNGSSSFMSSIPATELLPNNCRRVSASMGAKMKSLAPPRNGIAMLASPARSMKMQIAKRTNASLLGDASDKLPTETGFSQFIFCFAASTAAAPFLFPLSNNSSLDFAIMSPTNRATNIITTPAAAFPIAMLIILPLITLQKVPETTAASTNWLGSTAQCVLLERASLGTGGVLICR